MPALMRFMTRFRLSRWTSGLTVSTFRSPRSATSGVPSAETTTTGSPWSRASPSSWDTPFDRSGLGTLACELVIRTTPSVVSDGFSPSSEEQETSPNRTQMTTQVVRNRWENEIFFILPSRSPRRGFQDFPKTSHPAGNHPSEPVEPGHDSFPKLVEPGREERATRVETTGSR